MKTVLVILSVCLVSLSCQKSKTQRVQPNKSEAPEAAFDHAGQYETLNLMMVTSATQLMDCHKNTQESLHYKKHPRSTDDLEKSTRNLARFAQILNLERGQIQRYAETIKLFPTPPSELVEAKGLLIDMHVALESMADLMSIETDEDGKQSVSLTGDADTMEKAAIPFLNSSRRLRLILP